ARICTMDTLDRNILAELQADGRLTLTDLAPRGGLTTGPTQRRPRILERSGAITGYRAGADPDPLGLGSEALLFVTMIHEHRHTLASFETEVARITNVVQAQRYWGNRTICFACARPIWTATLDWKTMCCRHCRACNA